MPTYRIPDVVEVELNDLELPDAVPVDSELTEKPLAECTKSEVDHAVRAFSVLVQHGQREIETTIKKQIELRRRIAHLQAYSQHFDDAAWVREESGSESEAEDASP